MRWTSLIIVLVSLCPILGAEPCVSGLPKGQRPGPYSSLVSVGPKRGQPHCFICETGDKPAVVVFARTMSEPLGKLVRGLDKALVDHKTAEFCSWVTFLNDDQLSFDPLLVAWARKEKIRNVSLGVFEDQVGPPAYRLHKDADVTVLLFVNQKVVANHAFRAGEMTDERVTAILKQIPGLIPADKPAKSTP